MINMHQSSQAVFIGSLYNARAFFSTFTTFKPFHLLKYDAMFVTDLKLDSNDKKEASFTMAEADSR